ncbi:ATP-binding protein, partial [Delftia tsuruhatensis]
GRIVIGCRRQGQQLRIEVHDQGPGIPESLQHEIFEEFRRL